jgi:ParB-like chromosome segregation protein Spo0J
MAVQFDIEFSRGNEYLIFPEELTVNPDLNGRHELPDISELTANIEQYGQSTPVVIRRDGGAAVLVQGFSRWRALVDINKRNPKTKRQIRCVYKQLNEQEAFLSNVSENKFRNATTEDAHNIKRMLNVYSMTEQQVSEVYFPTAKTEEDKKQALKWVRKRVGLIGLTEEAVKAVKDGRVKGTAAAAIAKLTSEQQKKVVSKPGKIKGSDVSKVSGKTAPPDIKNKIQDVIDTGKFTVHGKDFEASDELVEFLALLLKPKSKR